MLPWIHAHCLHLYCASAVAFAQGPHCCDQGCVGVMEGDPLHWRGGEHHGECFFKCELLRGVGTINGMYKVGERRWNFRGTPSHGQVKSVTKEVTPISPQV